MKAKQERLCGIPAEYWLQFFKIFVEQREDKAIREQIEKLKKKAHEAATVMEIGQSDSIKNILSEVEALLNVSRDT